MTAKPASQPAATAVAPPSHMEPVPPKALRRPTQEAASQNTAANAAATVQPASLNASSHVQTVRPETVHAAQPVRPSTPPRNRPAPVAVSPISNLAGPRTRRAREPAPEDDKSADQPHPQVGCQVMLA